MGKQIYKKLVRDNIPSIIEKDGKRAITRLLSEQEYKKELLKKLLEEVNEYLQSEETEELADILEVLYSILALQGVSPAEIETMRMRKNERNGGFGQRIFLEFVCSD